MSTGDSSLDYVLEAGPRTVTPDTPPHVIEEIGKYRSFTSYREEMKRRKLERLARIKQIVARQCAENRKLEEEFKANPSVLPYAKIPVDLIFELEAENKQPWNAEMREHTLKCYPGLRLNFKFNTRVIV